MRKAVASLILLTILVAPMVSHADASIRQDSCVVFPDPSGSGKDFTRVWFTLINFSLPEAVCDLHFTSEPYPPTPNCILVDTEAPAGWSTVLIDSGKADWFADSAADCVAPGDAKDGFNFVLDPGFCCYVVEFTNAAGEVILTQEECFCDGVVSVEDETWGDVKKHFRE